MPLTVEVVNASRSRALYASQAEEGAQSMSFSMRMFQAEEFVKDFNVVPCWRLDDLMVSYATEGGGIGPHVDNYDVFLIQGK